MRLSRRRPVALGAALTSGLLLLLAFAPYGIWPAAAAGAGLLLTAVRGASIRRGIGLGLVCGAAFFAPLLHWSGIYVGPVPWLLLAASQTVFFGLLGGALAAARRVISSPLALAAVAAGLWVAQEALRTRVPYGGFPWGRLAFSSAEAWWLPSAALGGGALLTFVAALVGSAAALAAEAALERRPRRSLALAGAALMVLAASALVPRGLPAVPPVRTAVVAVLQGNVPRAGLDFNAEREAVLRNHVARLRELADAVSAGTTPRPDIVVWPENGSDIDPFTDPGAYALIDDAVAELGSPVLIGAVLQGPGRYISNTGILWHPGTGPGQRYVKRHPVPFAEYIPLRKVARLVSSAVDSVRRDYIAGTSVGLFSVPTSDGPILLGDVICFEVGYDGLVRDAVRAGAQVLAVQTNNATFGFTPQSEQQLVMSQIRAVEHGRTTLVAATSGISAIIDPQGRVVRRAELFTPAVLTATMPVVAAQTPATRLGVLPELTLSMVGVLGLGWAVFRRRPRMPETLASQHEEGIAVR